jgi:hypothetical protein
MKRVFIVDHNDDTRAVLASTLREDYYAAPSLAAATASAGIVIGIHVPNDRTRLQDP